MEFIVGKLTDALEEKNRSIVEIPRGRKTSIRSYHEFRIADGNCIGDEMRFLRENVDDLVEKRREFRGRRVGHQHIDVGTGTRT